MPALVKPCELCYMANAMTNSKLCSDCKDVVRHYLHMESCFEPRRRDLGWLTVLLCVASGVFSCYSAYRVAMWACSRWWQ